MKVGKTLKINLESSLYEIGNLIRRKSIIMKKSLNYFAIPGPKFLETFDRESFETTSSPLQFPLTESSLRRTSPEEENMCLILILLLSYNCLRLLF